MIKINRQTAIIAISCFTFIGLVVAASFVLGSKSGREDQGTDHPAEHHQGQSVSEDKYRSLVGKKAPDFTLYGFDGKKVSLGEQKGKKVVLFFTEGVMCYPSCWNQIAAFGKDEAFKKDDVAVFSIVVDTKNEWEKAVKKMPELGESTVLFDSSKNISKEYGILSLPSSMHKGQFPGHTYILLDKEGIVRFTKDDPDMAVRNNELKPELEKLN